METSNWVVTRPSTAASVALLGALLGTLVGCGGGGDDAASDTAAATPAAAPVVAPVTLAAKADKSYGVVRGRSGSTVEVYRDTSGAVTQSLYTNPTSGERVRVFADADGLPQRVLDEKTGNAMTITRSGADRLDYRAFDATGKYLGGYAVLVKADGLYAAPVSGTPSFSGQLSGQLNGATQTGSFALLPAADAGLGAAVPFSAAALAFDANLPTPAKALASAQAVAGIDRRAVIGGLAMGLAIGVGTSALPGLVVGAMTAYALQRIGLPIFDGVNNAGSIEQLSDNLNTFLDRFDSGGSATTAWTDALAGTLADRVKGATQRAFDAATDAVGSVVDRATLPALTDSAPRVDTAVSGVGVDQVGTSYSLTGNVAPSGALDATAVAATGGATIQINGNVNAGSATGAISGRLGNGTVSGTVGTLGQCAALQKSGGQGTFSFAFDAGATSGSLQFYREAYTIPDGFRVITNGQTLYDTGGLVSGSETRTLVLNGSRVLFVTVNAPTQGTQWELTVGCPV